MLDYGYFILKGLCFNKVYPLKYYIIAGESSGDNYGALLIESLKSIDPNAQFMFWGGPKMRATSQGQVVSIADTSFMGFWEVLKNIGTIRELFKKAKSTIKQFAPDMLILLDYPGFNLRLLKWAHDNEIKTTYYISPQLWAWKKKRYTKLRDYADLFFVILPFEKPFFDRLMTPCKYYGHPLTEIIPLQLKPITSVRKVGLFPGSRIQEIEKHLPILLSFAQKHQELDFKIARSFSY